MSILSLSHIDLDGIGCQIILNKIFDITRMNISYGKIDEYLDIIDSYCYRTKPKYVFITDLSFEIKHLEKLNNITKLHNESQFIFIDHHPIEEDYKHLNRPNLILIISEKASATKLTYLYLKKNFNLKENRDLGKFVDYVNAYDIWLEGDDNFKPGLLLNDLFWDYKIDYFYARFKDNTKIRMTDKERWLEIINKKNKLFNKLKESGRLFELGNKDLFMIFVDDYKSHITLDYPNYKVYVIFSSYGTASIRLSDSIKDPKLFKENVLNKIHSDNIISSGGHNKAFGLSIYDYSPSKQIELAKLFLNAIDEELDREKGL